MPLRPSVAAQVSDRDYFGKTKVRERVVAVYTTATPTEVLAPNPDRISWLILNTTAIYGVIRFNEPPTDFGFIQIAPLIGYASMHVLEDGEAVTYSVWGAGNRTGSMWYVMEVLRV